MVLRAAAAALFAFLALGVPAVGADAQSSLQQLESRVMQLEDVAALKRLQRALGYFLDDGQWDRAAELFADDATIELGLDGVYRGRARVREYLRALGGGRNGLAPGQLNEHFQLMPVITLEGDGSSARGTWRDVMLIGQLGKDAFWGEGPYENEYVKQEGVWRIRKLHWFQTLYVPYAGGWAKTADVNAARFVRNLTPDAPPSVTYPTWPGTFVPPFHFRHGKDSTVSPFVATTAPSRAPSDARVLAQRVTLLQDQVEIENLQKIFGFYIDKGQWDEAADLFSEGSRLDIAGGRAFLGQKRIREYLHALGPAGPAEGRLFDNMQLQPIVTVLPDRQRAVGRWHLFAQYAKAGEFHELGTGVYENTYVRENGRWKIMELRLRPTMFTPYEDGWGKTQVKRSRMEPRLRGDRTAAQDPGMHYPSPTDVKALARRIQEVERAARPRSSPREVDLAALRTRIDRLADVAEIENLQTIYGYYLATLEWDALAELFAPDGTIEIAMRGVYAGKPAVRRNLDLYGKQGLDQGVLHNHMQYQFVIHVAPDGETANLRSRALSMMGNYERNAQWMGGVYENEFVKLDGQWRFKVDHQMNTYFAPYETGWKDLALRPPPGVTATNPPDRPPSVPFEMYPKNFLPPYHYKNPVTDR